MPKPKIIIGADPTITRQVLSEKKIMSFIVQNEMIS